MSYGYLTPALAECDCLWQGSFAQSYRQADFIVSGTVINNKGNSADFNIERTLLDKGIGNKEFNSMIRFWADTAENIKQQLQVCRPAISDFPIGSEWVLALNKITDIPDHGFNPNTPNVSYGRINDYALSKCGGNWLRVNEGMVSGNLVKGRRWEWQNDSMNPVLIELVDAYIKDIIPEAALVEAAKPLTEAKILMEKTKGYLETQQ
ncbi:MAG: hypothetical protein ACJAYG_000015 [Oceanicoccus sp.]|jgi:hypothetical protein